MERKFASNILDVRSFRGADCGTDHYLVKTNFRCKINKCKKGSYKHARKYNIVRLKENPRVATALKEGFD